MATGAVVAIQDMGAAGLTCSAVEMGDKGDLGVRLNLDKVPTREENMTAYEMMLSESQERMLMALHPELEDVARAIFEKWDLDIAIVGETIAEDRFLILHGNEVKADLPLKALSGSAPEYDRPWTETPAAEPLGPVEAPMGSMEALRKLLGSPDLCSRRWIWEQYDHQVMADSVQLPGGDAAVVRVHGTNRGLAMTVDVTPRYCKANPRRGGAQAVAETWRNLTAVGAKPLAITDNLTFGNPEKPEVMGQFVACVQGIGQACEALDYPVVSGNVSLYNETDGAAILPTPAIGGVGVIEDLAQMTTLALKQADRVLVLVGPNGCWLGQTLYLREILGREAGDAPPVDLLAEKRAGDFVRRSIQGGLVAACHDLSDGGLAVAAAEMALAGGLGADLDAPPQGSEPHRWFFGEDQGRYLIETEAPEALLQAADRAGVAARIVGRTGGEALVLAGESAPLEELREIREGWLPAYMRGEA